MSSTLSASSETADKQNVDINTVDRILFRNAI